jgi:hypothetical protein
MSAWIARHCATLPVAAVFAAAQRPAREPGRAGLELPPRAIQHDPSVSVGSAHYQDPGGQSANAGGDPSRCRQPQGHRHGRAQNTANTGEEVERIEAASCGQLWRPGNGIEVRITMMAGGKMASKGRIAAIVPQ